MLDGLLVRIKRLFVSLPRTGERSYYRKDRCLVACVRGEYFHNYFVPSMDILARLSQEQKDSIILVETIPD